MIAVIIVALGAIIGLVVLAYVNAVMTKDSHDFQVRYFEQALTNERATTYQLVQQIQANTQGMVVHPLAYGPFEPEPEKRYSYDETGLIQYEHSEDDTDFAEAANI